MAYLSIGFKIAGKLQHMWKAAVRAYPDVSLSYTKHAGGAGYGTTLSPYTEAFPWVFNIQASTPSKQPETHCVNNVLVAENGVPVGDGACETPKPSSQDKGMIIAP